MSRFYSKMNNRYLKACFSLLCVALAASIMSINVNTFVNQGNLLPGGFTGLTLLIQRVLLKYYHLSVPYSPINITLNAFPAYIGYKTIGKRFTIFSIVMIVTNSFLIDIVPGFTITSDPLLIAIFGGLLNGTAISIALAGNASSGGTDFIGVYISEKLNISSWNIVLGINSCILLTSGLLFGFEAALYSIVFQFVSTQVVDRFNMRNHQMTLLIVTDHPEDISHKLMKYTHHGLTAIPSWGCYNEEERTTLYTVVTKEEASDVVKYIRTLDPSCFINVIPSTEVKGRFYKRPID